MSRCEATTTAGGTMGLIAAFDRMRDGQLKPLAVLCQLDEGHDGKHRGSYNPFPGFCDEVVYWGAS